MVTLGFIDLLLVLLAILALAYSLRERSMAFFYLVLIVVLLIEIERLAPGVLQAVGRAIHRIDTLNARLPHVEIPPLVNLR